MGIGAFADTAVEDSAVEKNCFAWTNEPFGFFAGVAAAAGARGLSTLCRLLLVRVGAADAAGSLPDCWLGNSSKVKASDPSITTMR